MGLKGWINRWRVALVGGAVLVLLTPSMAAANNFSGATGATGCMGGVNMADGGTHYFWYDTTTVAVTSMENWTRTYVYDPTDLVTAFDGSLSSTTDVIVRDQDYTTYCGYTWHGSGGSMWGLYVCEATTATRKCERSSVRYDLSYVNTASETDRRGLACHETGHTLGLKHYDVYSGCMKTIGPYFQNLSAHDISHVNANY